MSTASTQSRGYNRRVDSIQSNVSHQRESFHQRKRIIGHNDAYLYALRVAYLAYLLQPRAKRTQHVPAPATPAARTSTSINDLMKDFSIVRDSKSTRFPHNFMGELDKRLTGVLMGREKRLEYNDAAVKRTFAAFLNAFSEPGFRKRMEKDRRAEDLVLIFFSNATKELSKGKPVSDDSWKLMADRHLALFVRLISLVLKEHDWTRDRPELASRLSTLESRLLAHEQDLASITTRNGSGGTTIEVDVPLTYDVKDMPLVQVVGQIFGLRNSQMQSDINKFKPSWTENAALQDLKTYQNHLNMNTRMTLRNEDFDLDESYEQWKKNEDHDLSQMIMTIVQAYPELAKSVTNNLPQFSTQFSNHQGSDPQYQNTLRKVNSAEASSYVVDQPVDMSSLEGDDQRYGEAEEEATFTFIPPDTRGFYRFVLTEALKNDLHNGTGEPSEPSNGTPPTMFLSKKSTDLLNEIGLRWRLPSVSRMSLFLDVIREKFVEQDISVEALDDAFNFVKDHVEDKDKGPTYASISLSDRRKWPVADVALNQQTISNLHIALLRDLFDTLQHCYEPKPPSVGPVIFVLENHIFTDPSFSKTADEIAGYSSQLYGGLTEKAHEVYRSFLEEHVPSDQNTWDFVHVIDLGKAVVALAQRIQKRYRKNPEVLG